MDSVISLGHRRKLFSFEHFPQVQATSFVFCYQERAPQATVDDTAALPTNRNSDGSRTNSAPTEKIPSDPLSESQAAYVFIVCCLKGLY